MNRLKQRLFTLFIFSIFIITGTITVNARENTSVIYTGPSYDGIRAFSSYEDLSKYGYMDEEGNIIVPCEYSSAADLINGYGLISKETGTGTTYGAVNTKGEFVLNFDSQLGSVNYYNGNAGIVTKYYDAATAGRSALINGEGKLITGYDYYTLLDEKKPPCYGVIYAEKVSPGGSDPKRGIIDWNGNTVIPLDYFDIINTQENWSILSVGKMIDGKPKYGYIYANGVEMLPCIYDKTETFSNGFGTVDKDGKYAAINANGVFTTQFIYDLIEPFHEGLAVVVKSGKAGMIDINGQEVFPCKYYSLSQSTNGVISAQESETSQPTQLENPLVKSRMINIYKNGS